MRLPARTAQVTSIMPATKRCAANGGDAEIKLQ
jgi:hypothetical protein